jgi:GTP cyclohydrolase I
MRDPSFINSANEIGEEHIATSIETPIREDAFDLDNETKIEEIEKLFERIMLTLGLDLSDDSLKGTPHRVAKMYVNEIFNGLDPVNKPVAKSFDNKYKYKGMVVEKSINVSSTCEHHFVPIIGKAHVAYIPNGHVIGLSKMNRIVDYYSRRPQVQERLNKQILNELKEALGTEDVAVVIEAKHFCVHSRGIKDTGSTTTTADYSGKFNDNETRKEFLHHINNDLLK